MKNLKDILTEGFIIKKHQVNNQVKIKYTPTKRLELIKAIVDELKEGNTNLNCIDVSKIEDMSDIFADVQSKYKIKIEQINISNWDVSNVRSMNRMFADCKYFDANIKAWDVSNVITAMSMFRGCKKFTCDLSNWKLSNINPRGLKRMFDDCDSLKKLPEWYK